MGRHSGVKRALAVAAWLVVTSLAPSLVWGQQTGTVTGRITRAADGSAMAGVTVSIQGTGVSAVTGPDGRYTLTRVPAGPQVLLLRQFGQRPTERPITVPPDGTLTMDVALVPQPVSLGEVVVQSASRLPERVVEAPASITVVDPATVRDVSATGQPALVVSTVPGVDVVQSGINDFNVNARGFNTTLNRRILVLQDGRDLAVAFLGAQEWGAFALPTEDFDRVEMVRGPGSALYGANAFSGVLNITTPAARDVRGTKLTVAGGELSTFRGDLRHAGVFGGGRFGYRINAGYSRSGTFTKARTDFDGAALAREYAAATDSTVPNQDEAFGGGLERRPLTGQTVGPNGVPVGDPDPLQNIFGSARFDYYAPGGSVVTVDGGAAHGKNELAVTGLGRVQVKEAVRPWARVNWASDHYNLMAWYSGRITPDSQVTLGGGTEFREYSAILHTEGQYNRSFLDDKARIVLGASFRNYQVDTRATLMRPADDNRSDNYYSVYGQLEYRLLPQVRLVGATRWDKSDLFESQFSPKGGIVFSPNNDHSIRLTFNRAFQTPNYSEFFLFAAAGAPTDGPSRVERGLETLFSSLNGGPLGPAVQDLQLPNALPWDFDAVTTPLALGNSDLEVETINTWELGYKGTLNRRFFVTVDVFLSELKNFVTDLLPCVNPDYPCYSLGDQGTNIPKNLNDLEARVNLLEMSGTISPAQAAGLRSSIGTLRAGYGAVAAGAGPFLAIGPTGAPTPIVSYANAGRVIEYGSEIGIGAAITDELRVDANYAFIEVKVREFQAGDALVPNTPRHRGNLAVSYRGRQGLDASAALHVVTGHQWLAGVFGGWVPARQTVDASVGYAINSKLRAFVIGTNVFDQKRYHMFGGSLVERRVLGGVTATF